MADKDSKKKIRRKSKSERTHIRRMKQAARKEAVPNNPSPRPVPPVQSAQKPDQS